MTPSRRSNTSEDATLTLTGAMVDVAGAGAFRMVLRSKADGTLEREMYDTISPHGSPHGDVQVMSTVSERVP